MRLAEELLGGEKDEHGVIHIGKKSPGCKHCGAKVQKVAANGKVVIHHPGAECCPAAVKDQIAYRTEELRVMRKLEVDLRHAVEEAEAHANELTGRDASTAKAAAAKMRRSYDQQVERWKLIADGDPDDPLSVGLKDELTELERTYARLYADEQRHEGMRDITEPREVN